ncbi:MAG: aminotransferase class III-fold pyridoxal phosphate-dependent enzyme, partial [Albidovulum sp.]|uniref:aminotransferase class III-fold pyridoxal phosphate-dependent enzyme n=1 Tax=Albidovulum sp. TaxID=1872424 RepID=UPI003CC4357B
GGLWCMNIGYGREEMVEAIAAQTRRLAFASPFVDMGTAPAAQLAAKLAKLAPGTLNHVLFGCGGSVGNDSAFRLIQYYWACKGQKHRRHIIARTASYHGSTYAAQSIGGKPTDRSAEFDFIPDIIHHVAEPNIHKRPAGMSEEAFTDFLIADFRATLDRLGPENIAAHYAEPVMGAGGVIVPPRRYITEVHAMCQKHGIIYVADEVVTAFGRLGAWFAAKDVFGIQPDIIVCAKGLTSGYLPLGATIYSDEIHDTISAPGHDRWFSHGFTYSGHPVACAAALKNIEIIEREGLLAHVRDDVGPYFIEQLRTLLDFPTVGLVRGMKLMACIMSVRDKATLELFPPEVNIGKRVSNAAEKRGLLVRPLGSLNVMSPPLTITRAEVDDLIVRLRAAMEDVLADLRREGLF